MGLNVLKKNEKNSKEQWTGVLENVLGHQNYDTNMWITHAHSLNCSLFPGGNYYIFSSYLIFKIEVGTGNAIDAVKLCKLIQNSHNQLSQNIFPYWPWCGFLKVVFIVNWVFSFLYIFRNVSHVHPVYRLLLPYIRHAPALATLWRKVLLAPDGALAQVCGHQLLLQNLGFHNTKLHW